MSLLLLFSADASQVPAAVDHWAEVREGDILPVLLPFAGRVAFCGYVRVLSRTYREDADELLDVETQWIEPVTATTPLRFVAEGGAVAPPVIAVISQVAEQLTAVSKEAAALGARLNAVEDENKDAVPKGRLVDNVVGAINDSTGGIDGSKVSDGTLPATTLDGAVEVDASNNVKLATATDTASGQKVVAIPNATATPSGTPSGGGVLYAESGALKWKGSSGTVTEIAPA